MTKKKPKKKPPKKKPYYTLSSVGCGRWEQVNERHPQCEAVKDGLRCTLDDSGHLAHAAVHGKSAAHWQIQRWTTSPRQPGR